MEKNKLQCFEESLSEAVIKIHREAMLRQKKVIIEKATQWLIRGGYFVNSNETIEDFRKAMEE